MRSSFHLLDRYENDDVIVSEDIFLMKSMELTVKFMMELMESRTKSLWAELMMEVSRWGAIPSENCLRTCPTYKCHHQPSLDKSPTEHLKSSFLKVHGVPKKLPI